MLVTKAPEIDPTRVAIYVRWSTEEQGQGTTLEVQRESCEHYCKSKGWAVNPALLFVDDGYSGGSLNRPAITKLRKAVKEGAVSAVVVYKLDRLTRSLKDAVNLVRDEWAKTPLYSTQESFDTASPVGEMLFNMLVSFGQFERNTIRDRMMSGKVKRVEQGRHIASHTPYGYFKNDDRELMPHPETADVVRMIFRQVCDGITMMEITRRLNTSKIPSPTGKTWTVQGVRHLLHNDVYRGIVTIGRPRARGNYLKEVVSVEGTHEPLIDSATWVKAQQILTANSRVHPRVAGSDYLFSGVMVCRHCGKPMTGDKWKWQTKDGMTRHIHVYRCRTNNSSGTCMKRKIKEYDAEAVLLQFLEQLQVPNQFTTVLEQRLAAQQKAQTEIAAVRKNLMDRLATVDRALAKLTATFLETDTLTDLEYKQQKTKYQTEREEVAAVLAQHQEPQADEGAASMDDLLHLAAHIKETWPEATQDERKRFIRNLLTAYSLEIVADENGIEVVPKTGGQ